MNPRFPCFAALALLIGGRLQGQPLTYSPLNPEPGDSVTVRVPSVECGGTSFEKAVTPPDSSANGVIRLTILQTCFCIATPVPITFVEEIGPLAFGTYDILLYAEIPDELCPPPPPQLIATAVLTVSHGAGIVALRPDPAHPVAGQPVTVAFETYCPSVWKAPRLQAAGGETLIIVDQDPEAPQPAAPCTSQPTYGVRLPAGALAAGGYRLQVRTGPDSPHLETVAESAFTVVPAGPVLSLRQGRFLVRAEWSAPGFGQGSAQAMPLTDESGYFTFFNANNVELIVKVLNGCPVNQRYWVFMAGLTNVGVTIFVEDTLTGHQEIYSNPVGQVFQPVVDTSRFATCP
jgi:hypothetical protein